MPKKIRILFIESIFLHQYECFKKNNAQIFIIQVFIVLLNINVEWILSFKQRK